MNDRAWLVPAIVVIAILSLCCICIAVLGFTGALFGLLSTETQVDDFPAPFPTLENTPVVIRPTDSVAAVQVPRDTLETLENTVVPVNDLRELAQRLEGKGPIPKTLNAPTGTLTVGTRERFWVTNVDSDTNFQIEATLQYITDHLYFWVEDGIRFDADDLAMLAETFENDIYPTNRAFFGSEWSPGVDGDPHLYILYADELGRRLAGYFSSVDSIHPLAHEFSNGHEMFVLNADIVNLGETYTYSVLAHEFQHMIHWNLDRNEQSWMNEGFSQLAAFLNGYTTGGDDIVYAGDPDLQLNDWPNDPSQTTPHYGAAFLFLTYFLDRFGREATQTLVGHPANGLTSIDAVLQELSISDVLSGEPVQTDDVFMDWVLANYLQDSSVADGRYAYRNYLEAPKVSLTETIRACQPGMQARAVRQYGADYIRITCKGDHILRFEGSIPVDVVPEDPHSGAYAFWSNKGDESDMTLTRQFDFTDHDGPLTLTYWTWYDIEENWDYVYLLASADGENWEILTTPSGTDDDPTGNSYGWGYTGLSGGEPRWIQEMVDLSRFSGEQILLRFEYITDAAVNGEGLLLDDVEIPEIRYATDFENDDGGWQAEGFVRIQNVLPQTFRLALIERGAETTVQHIQLSSGNTADIPIRIGSGVNDLVLVVAGTTRHTRQPATYQFEFRAQQDS